MHKKIFSLSVICSIIAPLCVHGGGRNQKNGPSAEEAAEEKQQQIYAQQMNQITPCAPPLIKRGADPYLTADFIWWRAQEDGTSYAVNGTAAPVLGPGAVAQNAATGSLKSPKSRYEPGFKVGMGLKFRHDGWDLFAQYTWWKNNQSKSSNSLQESPDGNSYVIGAQFGINAGNTTGASSGAPFNTPLVEMLGLISPGATSISGNWSLKFNAIDLELGRDFWISGRLTLRPFIGMKLAQLTQKVNIHYANAIPLPDSLVNADLKHGIRQWGVGLRGGLGTAWHMSDKWSIFGDLALTSLWNNFRSTRQDILNAAPIPSIGFAGTVNQKVVNLRTRTQAMTAVLETALGIRFETLFHKDDFKFLLQAGWENQIWFDQSRFMTVPNTPSNLNFQGLTVKAGLNF